MGTDVPDVTIWNYLYLSSLCFVSNAFISILSYVSHQGPRDPQTFSINRQVVSIVDFVSQMIFLNHSPLLLWPQSSCRHYTIE